MISAEGFARQNGVWHQSTPTLENYMRWVNKNLSAVAGDPVPSISEPGRSSLISETAFLSLFNPMAAAEDAARSLILTLPRGEHASRALTAEEMAQAEEMRDLILVYLQSLPSSVEPTFQPRFPGCGVVEAAQGDILLGKQLIEIKAVRRPFRSVDLRQLLSYATLGYAAGILVDVLTLLNPRQATSFSTNVNDLALDVGAGSWVELMKDLIEAMSGLEVSL